MEGLLQEEDNFRCAQGIYEAIVKEVYIIAKVRIIGFNFKCSKI